MKLNIQKILGNWDEGYAMDKHLIKSTFIGYDENGRSKFENVHTEIGQAIYDLKYSFDFNNVTPIAKAITANLEDFLADVDIVIPMPPSKFRTRQPVHEIASAIADILDKPYFDNLLKKNGNTAQMKGNKDKESKKKSLLECFDYNDVLEDDFNNILIVDDLFDTGASLEAACEVLRGYDKINNIYVVTVTRTGK